VTTTLSPPIRILAVVGVLAVVGLGIILYGQGRSSSTDTSVAVTPHTLTHRLHATLQHPRKAQPAAAPRIVPLPGLPRPVAHALRYSKVVVVSLYASGAAGDRAALQQARLGAKASHAGFAAVNVLNEGTALGLGALAGTTSSPAVLVIRRPGRIVNRFLGYADSDLVAQAAQNAGARSSR